jgi:hypothetical protein
MEAKLNAMNKQRAFAWAKYFEAEIGSLRSDWVVYRTITRNVEVESELPIHMKDEFIEMAKTLKKKWECAICMDFIEHENLHITSCGHKYCKECIEGHIQTQKAQGKTKWDCPTCRRGHKIQ